MTAPSLTEFASPLQRVALAASLLASSVFGGARAADVSPSPDKLERITEFFNNEVTTGKLPGGCHPDPAAWSSRLAEVLWRAGRRDRSFSSNDAGHHLCASFHDEAHHQLGRNDADRRRRALAR
jgi:hypothetical protein